VIRFEASRLFKVKIHSLTITITASISSLYLKNKVYPQTNRYGYSSFNLFKFVLKAHVLENYTYICKKWT